MTFKTLLWIDFCADPETDDPSLGVTGAHGQWHIHRVHHPESVKQMLLDVAPDLLCFDYDYPHAAGLRLLREVRNEQPAVPVVILTQYHSESFALWALRLRVRNFLIKPVALPELLASCDDALSRTPSSDTPELDAAEADFQRLMLEMPGSHSADKLTAAAVTLVVDHYDEKITLIDASHACRLPVRQFNAVFEREHGLSFKDFLLHFRIDMACKMLSGGDLSVTEIAFAVGFNDHSHFARLFRQCTGLHPSAYRRRFIDADDSKVKRIRARQVV